MKPDPADSILRDLAAIARALTSIDRTIRAAVGRPSPASEGLDPSVPAPVGPPVLGDADLMSAADVAKRLGVSTETVLRYRRNGAMPEAVTIGRLLRWQRSVIDEWILAGRTPAGPA